MLYVKSNEKEIIELLPKNTCELKELIEKLSNNCIKLERETKVAVISPVTVEDTKFVMTMNFEDEYVELVNEIVNSKVYGIDNESWNSKLEPLMNLVQNVKSELIIEQLGDDDYLWTTLKVPMKKFDNEKVVEIICEWNNLNNSIREMK